jgi:hypothetical protein
MSKPSRRLVIDASVGAAAGQTNFPTSRRSREFLTEVLKISHRAVMTQELAQEWDDHQTRFSRLWRVEMRSRRKVVDLEHVENEQVRSQVRSTKAVLKDLHLIEAALATDNTVISLDDRARHDLAVEATEEIMWVNAVPENRGDLLY